MIPKKELILRFTDDFIDSAILIKKNNSINLKEVSKVRINDEQNISEIKKFIKRNKVIDKEVTIILSSEVIITRVIELPLISNKELEKFIDNNISEYFTINIDEYFYDYTIMELEKQDKKLVVLLVAFQKDKLSDVIKFVSKCKIKIKTITVYPYCIYKAFYEHKNLSIAIFDITNGKMNTTILNENGIFLYSYTDLGVLNVSNEFYQEIYENIIYFLNFYSTRHFGNKIDRIHLIGELSNDTTLLNLVGSQFEKELSKDGIEALNLKVQWQENLNINNYYDIIGSSLKDKKIYNKKIDFYKKVNVYNEEQHLKNIVLGLIITSIILFILNFSYIQYMFIKYNNSFLDRELEDNISIEKEINEKERLSIEFNQKSELLKIIENDKFKYEEYLNIIKSSMPEDIGINKIMVDREKVYISLNIKETLDKIRAVNALNNTGIFETVEIDSIKLNNTETKADFTIKSLPTVLH